MNNQIDKIWRERAATLPSALNPENLSESLLEYGLKREEEETKFFLEHSAHGTVVLKHILIAENPITLSDKHRGWTTGNIHEFDGIKKWEYHLVCKNCHKSLVVVNENTPDELKAI